MMHRRWLPRGLKFLAFGLVAITLFGWVVMSLWNWLIPGLTGWHTLGFAQALGLLVLCRILFGRFGHRRWGPGGGAFGGPGWAHLSEEERERFRARFGARCGGRGDKREAAQTPSSP